MPIRNATETVKITDGLTDYYHALEGLGTEGSSYADKHSTASAEVWHGLAFAGLTVKDVVDGVVQAYDNGSAVSDPQPAKESRVGASRDHSYTPRWLTFTAT
jgi:hypothetical protein